MPTSEAQPASCPVAARLATSLPVACAGIYEALTTMSPAAIAAELGCPLTDLLDFLQSQPFAQYAAQRNDGWRQAALVRAHGALPDAIDALRTVCAHADNLRERRTAAGALLRFIVGRPPPRERPPQPSQPTDASGGQHRGARATDVGSAKSVSPEAPSAPAHESHPPIAPSVDHGPGRPAPNGHHRATDVGFATSVSPEPPAIRHNGFDPESGAPRAPT